MIRDFDYISEFLRCYATVRALRRFNLSIAEAATRLGTSRQVLHAAIVRGELDYVRIRCDRCCGLLDLHQVERFFQERRRSRPRAAAQPAGRGRASG